MSNNTKARHSIFHILHIFLSLLKADKAYLFCLHNYYMVSCILLFALFFCCCPQPYQNRPWTHFWVTTRQLRTNKVVGIEHSGSHKCRSETQRQWIKECLSQGIWAKVSRMFISAVVVPPSHPDPLHISMSDSSVFWHTDRQWLFLRHGVCWDLRLLQLSSLSV